jgi:hypothetical protein
VADIVIINPRFDTSFWGMEHCMGLLGKRAMRVLSSTNAVLPFRASSNAKAAPARPPPTAIYGASRMVPE